MLQEQAVQIEECATLMRLCWSSKPSAQAPQSLFDLASTSEQTTDELSMSSTQLFDKHLKLKDAQMAIRELEKHISMIGKGRHEETQDAQDTLSQLQLQLDSAQQLLDTKQEDQSSENAKLNKRKAISSLDKLAAKKQWASVP